MKYILSLLVFIVLLLSGCGYSNHQDQSERLVSFLADDDTNFNLYQPGKFVCYDFSFQLNQRAEEAGIPCAIVLFHVTYAPPEWGSDYQWHYINAFKTEKGLVFIEPRTDREVRLQMGEYYFWVNEGWDEYGYVDKIYIGW